MPPSYRWILRKVEAPGTVTQLQAALNDLPTALARGLVVRGVKTLEEAKRFFRPSREYLHDPFLMQDMEVAATRLAAAVSEREHVLVYGDYDVDGTTSAAMMTAFLREEGAGAHYFIPDRHRHGYGLSRAGIDHAAEQGATLIVALDCGITARDEAAYARTKGLDLIICDHHTAGATLPDALAVLDPKRPDCRYPFKELSGCGVGFKLIQATLDRLGQAPEKAFQFADLLAVSIASDIVPVYGENRVLLREGLRRLQSSPRLGLRMLMQKAELDPAAVTAGRIVFTIGPRINAAGRLDHARHAVDLMLAQDEASAARHAETLEKLNAERKTIDRETAQAAFARAERQLTARQRHALVLYQPEWHQGVIGIVASRVVEKFYRPTVMLASAGDVLKGSARSISGINIYEALKECEDLLEQFGGHDYAAGLSLDPRNLDPFAERLDAAIGEAVTPELLLPSIKIDATLQLEDIGTVNDRFWAVLKQFEPFGPRNSRPVFRACNVAVAGSPKTVGRSERHLKFAVRSLGSETNGTRLDAIGFGMSEHLATLRKSEQQGRPVDLLFSIEENTWRGRTSLQLKARDLRLSEK